MSRPAIEARVQAEYFDHADVEHFHWTTAGAIADTEDALLAPVLDALQAPCLEIGCGEGNNLVRLARRVRCLGTDLFAAKLRFAAAELPTVPFAAADAAALPFRDGSFRSVFIRDLLHHVPAPERVLAEAMRVLAPGGRFCLLEPNGRNPIVNLHSRLVPAEAAERTSDPEHIATLLRGLPLEDMRMTTAQPLPLSRLVLHYRLGLPGLGRVASLRRALVTIEELVGRLLPRSRWAYVAVVAARC